MTPPSTVAGVAADAGHGGAGETRQRVDMDPERDAAQATAVYDEDAERAGVVEGLVEEGEGVA